MPKLDLAAIPQTNATGYPPPFDAQGYARKDGTRYAEQRVP